MHFLRICGNSLTKADDLSDTFKTIQYSNRYRTAHFLGGNYLICSISPDGTIDITTVSMKPQIMTNVVFFDILFENSNVTLNFDRLNTWAFGQMITWNWWWVYWKAFGLFPLLDVGMKRQGVTQTKLFRVFSLRRRLFSSQQDYRTDLGLASTHIDRVDNLKTKSEPSLLKKKFSQRNRS